MSRLGRLAVLSAVGMIFSSSTGWASTVSAEDPEVRYVAAPGEVNAVVITEEGLGLRISDSGASISAGPGCVSQGADALCDIGSMLFVQVLGELGDGDDSADLSGLDFPPGMEAWSVLKGGPGSDSLIGGAGDDHFYGNDGDDELVLGAGGFGEAFGGPGNDTIRGGPGEDLLTGGGGDDILDGGAGRRDHIFARGMNLRLTPTALFFGASTDTLNGIESASLTGGDRRNVINARTWRGATFIHASGGDDLIVGGFGPDEMVGGRGNDRIAGRAGRDKLFGDFGADVLFARDYQRDEVGGGLGLDWARVDGLDFTWMIEAFLP